MSVHFGYADVLYSSRAPAGRFIGAGIAAALNLRCLTNGRAFPAPSNPQFGALLGSAKMGSANFHQLTRKEKAHEHYCDRN